MRTLNSFYINISQKYFTFHKNILQGQLITTKWAMGNKVVMSVGVITTILLSEACSLLIRFLIRIYCEGKNVRKCIKLPSAARSWVNVQPCNYGDGKNEIFLHCRKILYNVYSTTQREWAIKVCTLHCFAKWSASCRWFQLFQKLSRHYSTKLSIFIWCECEFEIWTETIFQSPQIQDFKWFPWSRWFWSRQFKFKLPVSSCNSFNVG